MINWEQFSNEGEAIKYLKTAKDITCATTRKSTSGNTYQKRAITRIRS